MVDFMMRIGQLIESEKLLIIKSRASADWVATKTYVVIEIDVAIRVDVVT